MVSFFAAPQLFETEVFVPWRGMELPDPKSSISKARHRPAHVRSATRFHLHGLTRHRICLRIAEHAGRGRLAPRADRVARGNTHRARRVCIPKSDPPSHQSV